LTANNLFESERVKRSPSPNALLNVSLQPWPSKWRGEGEKEQHGYMFGLSFLVLKQ